MCMSNIIQDVQKISEAISSVLNIDVTVIDSELTRIAGTGRYRNCVGDKVGEDSAFYYAMEKGENLVILDPGKHPVCIKCSNYEDCKEYAEVCCPIKVNGKSIAVIGLIAFTKDQRERIISNKEALLKYIDIMSQLISSKVLEKKNHQAVKLLAEELNVVVEALNKGILVLDHEGKLVSHNKRALEYLNMKEEELRSQNFMEIFSLKYYTAYAIRNREVSYLPTGFKGVMDVNTIMRDSIPYRIVIILSNYNEVVDTLNSLYVSTKTISFDDIVGTSKEILSTIEKAKKVSKSSSTVLITGESGTGKELFARGIHRSSSRKNNPFVAINCAAIPDSLLESELFGYVDGAFTGANKNGKSGKFEMANKGTIFLDEIGDMPLHLQTKLLRVLQEGTIEKIGSNDIISVDSRIIAATNKNLEDMVSRGEFREDLYYRLNVVPLKVPALRDRDGDIPMLLEHFLKVYNEKLNKKILAFSDDVMSLFVKYNWPGNVRELQNVIEYSMNMCSKEHITINDIPERIMKTDKALSSDKEEFEEVTLKEIEKVEIIRRIKMYKSSEKCIDNAAKSLGISRATLYRKLKEYEIKIKDDKYNYI